MGKQLIATGQATVIAQKDSYTINQSVSEYIFTAQSNGTVPAAVSFSSTIKVTLGDLNITDFTVGAITKPSGFSSITVNNTNKTVTYSVAAGTTTLADNGLVFIPVIIAGVTYQMSFAWSKAKVGATGSPGTDANMLDWVQDWNSNKTTIGSNSVITPKVFAGVKNANGTITGTAIGRFSLSTLNASGTVTTEVIDGVYGFRDGNKTFSLDNTGNVQLGRGNQYIKYNAATGQVEFGSDVSLAWVGATFIDRNGIFTGTLSANTINALQLNASQITAGTINAARIDVTSLKTSLITAGNIEALTLNVVRGKIGGWSVDTDSIYRGTKNNTAGVYTASSGSVTIGSNGIRGFKWRLDSTGAGAVAGGNISWDASGNVTFGSSVVLKWTTPINSITTALGGSSYPKLTQISSTGVYTGTLTAAQINAVSIDAGSIKAGILSADRIAANSINGNKIVARTISADRIITGTITANEIASKTITAAKITAGTITATEINVSNIQASVVTAGAVNGLSCTFVRGTIGGWGINSTQIYKNSVYLNSDGSITNGSKWQLNNNGSGRLANGNISWDTTGNVTFGANVTIQWDVRSQTTIDARSLDVNKYYPVCINLPTRKNVQLQIGYALEGVKPSWATHTGGYSVLIKWTSNGSGWGTQLVDRRILTATQSFCSGNVVGNIGQVTEASQEYIYVRGGGLYYFEVIGTDTRPTLYPTGASWHNVSINPVTSVTFPKVSLDAVSEVANNTQNALGGVSYPKLTQITSTGIYTGSINASQINAGTISADRIAVSSLHGNRITARTISADRIVVGAITATEIATRTITADRIVTGVITANEIAGGTITAAKIATRTITADRIASGAITANEIASRAITAAKIAAGTITANEIATKTITASCIATGTITANEVNTNSLRANIVTAEAVNGLTCTFEKGKIGGFEILGWKLLAYDNDNGNGIKHYVEIHNTGYICNARTSDDKDFWALNRDGSADFGLGKIHFGADGDGWFANKNISWTTSGNITMTGTITATAGRIAGFNISGNSLVNSTSTASIILNNLAGQSFVRINESTSSPLLGIRTDVSNRTGLSISTYASGATGLYIINNVGGAGAIKSYGSHTFGQRSGETWNAPGVLYIGSKYNAGQNSSYKKIFGDGLSITSSTHLGGSKYKFNHNLGHTEYTVFAQTISSQAYYGSYRLLERTSTYFVIQNVGSSGGADNAPFDFIIYGRNKI